MKFELKPGQVETNGTCQFKVIFPNEEHPTVDEFVDEILVDPSIYSGKISIQLSPHTLGIPRFYITYREGVRESDFPMNIKCGTVIAATAFSITMLGHSYMDFTLWV